MYYLRIDNLEFKKFPGGELHITTKWLDDLNCHFPDRVLSRIQNSDDFMKLALFTDSCKRALGELPKELVLPYIPYARQDRVPVKGEALSIKVFTQFLNSLNYSKVTVFDPHSDVSTALIENVNIVPQWEIWKNEVSEMADSFDLISPDAGALKKIYKLQEKVNSPTVKCRNIRIGMKHRDTMTGAITGTSVNGNPICETAVVVDDICDGGRTFVELGKVLRKEYKKLILCITHGIFSKGLDELSSYYDEIYTTNSWSKDLDSTGKLKVIKVC